MNLTQSDIIEYIQFCNSQIAYTERNLATLDEDQDEYYECEKELKQYLNARKIITAVLVNNLPCKCENDCSFAVIGEAHGVKLRICLLSGLLDIEWDWGTQLNKTAVHTMWSAFADKYKDYLSGCYVDIFPEVNDRYHLEMEKVGFNWGTYSF